MPTHVQPRTDEPAKLHKVKQELVKGIQAPPKDGTNHQLQPNGQDMKKEVKEEVSKDVQVDVKTEIKEEASENMSQEVKDEIPKKDMKQEVKKEVPKDEMKPEVGDEAAEDEGKMRGTTSGDVVISTEGNDVDVNRPFASTMAVRTASDLLQHAQLHPVFSLPTEDHDWQRRMTGVKRELVDEEEQVRVKEEQAEQAGPIQDAKRRRISQKRSDTSVTPFESRLAEWAEKCLAFQSSGKTCMRLGKEQFRELRDFYRENPHHVLFRDNNDQSSERQPESTAGSRPQAHRSSTGNQHRAAECMKMWPWMRDLPTRTWAGNGWLLVEDGMMKLSPTGGGSAMQGLEIFESVGSVPEPGEQKPLESTSQVEPRAEGEQVLTKSFRGLERQSGIQDISWLRFCPPGEFNGM
eukprot:s3112_g8.t1